MNLRELTSGTPATKPWLTIKAFSVEAKQLDVEDIVADVIDAKEMQSDTLSLRDTGAVPNPPIGSVSFFSTGTAFKATNPLGVTQTFLTSGGPSAAVQSDGSPSAVYGLPAYTDATGTIVGDSGVGADAAARGDLVSAAVLPPGARNAWSAATGSGTNACLSQAYIPSINRIVAGGNSVGAGAHFSDNGGVTWTAATTVIASSGNVGYSESLGVLTWRAYATTEVRTSVDNGVNWTLQAPFVGSFGIGDMNILRVDALGLFIVSDGGAATISTSPDGITWTLQASATRQVLGVVWTGTRLVSVGNNGVMSSADGVTWVNEASTVAMLTPVYSPELGQIVASTTAASTLMYVSTDDGVTFTSLDVKPDNSLLYSGLWSAELGGYYFAQNGATAGLNNIWVWDGSARPFAGGQAFGLTLGSGLLGAATGVYTLYYYPFFRRFSLSFNAASAVYTAIRGPNENVAAVGSGSVAGQALMLRSGAVQADRGLSSQFSQLYMNSAASELRHRFNSIEYPLAGVNLTKIARFDGSLSQTFFNDGVITINWDGVNKQARLNIAATPWFTATGFETTFYFSFGSGTPNTQANEALAFLAATNYYFSSAAVARNATCDMNKATPMEMNASTWPSTGTTSTTPMYQVQVRLAPSFAGNYRVQKIYQP